MEMCYFGLITRVVGRLRSINYERASPLSKTLLEAATHIDHFLIESAEPACRRTIRGV